MPKLTYVVGSAGETRSVDVGDSCSIGSLAGNTIVLDAPLGASRRHCQLLKIQNGYEVADLGSTNGTKVNGETVKRRKLANGDRIEVGKVVLTFDDGSGASAAGDDEISLEEHVSASPGPSQSASAKTGVAASDQCMLVFAGGEKDGQKIALDKPRVTFGRNPKNVVPLNDNGASGFHAEISREGGTYVLRDLGSTNGTLVDGEPVSETALQHGARIRMGNTRLVFVDPTVSDFEKAMAAVDDLGSEWGMLRAEMDMTRVQRARRSQALTIGVLLVVVLGGGALVYVNRDKIAGGTKPLENVDGNKVADYSFETQQGADWTARPRSPTKSPRAGDPKSDGAARQGTAFLAVTRDGPGGACAAAQSSIESLITVSPGHAAEFGAWVRCANGAMGGVRISWIDKPDASGREVGRSASPLTASAQWQLVKGVAMPPGEARAARLELINAAGGTAFFDDVFFTWGGANAGGSVHVDNPITLTATSDAQATVARGDTKLLIDGAVVGGALRPDALDNPALRGDRAGSQSISGTGGLVAEGTLVEPKTGEPKNFRIAVEASGGRYVDVNGALPPGADAAWIAILPREFYDGGIGVQFEGDFVNARDPRIFEKVTEVGFGGRNRFKITRGERCGPLRFVLTRVGDVWEVGFGVSEGNLSIRIDTDSAALTADIDKLRQQAGQAKAQKKFGEAIVAYKQLKGFYPKGSVESDTVQRESDSIEVDGKSRLDKIEKRAAGAIRFRDADELRDMQRQAEALAAEFDKYEVGDKAALIGKQLAAAAEADRLTAEERDAAPLLRKADDFREHEMFTLARVFYNEVIQRFPGTDAEKKARENLAGLKK